MMHTTSTRNSGLSGALTRLLSLALVAAVAFGVSDASAQLTPDRLYYGKDRTVPMTITVPDGTEGEVEIRMYVFGEAEPTETAAASAGGVDLSGLFPALWSEQAPAVLYAQLFVGDEGVGSPVVIQRMLSPDYATSRGREVVFQSQMSANRPVTYSGVRAYVEHHVLIETSLGNMRARLRPDEAPNTAFNFRHLASGGYYTDIIFHRVVAQIPQGPFVIQVGDPTGQGSGGPGYMLDLEKSSLQHDFGVLSMARSGDPNSNGSQFFVCLSRPGTAFLDGNYCTFGEVLEGAETILAIAATPVGPGDRPTTPPVLKSATMIPAPPYTGNPEPRVTRPEEPGDER